MKKILCIFIIQIKKSYEEGHHYGEIDGVMNVQTDEVSYQLGLEDAWECVKKITYEKTEGGFDFREHKEIFDGRILLSEILVNYRKIIAEPTEGDIAKTIGGQNDFAECIREAVKTVFANAPTIIEADKVESEE